MFTDMITLGAVLIAIYLFVANANATTKIITALGSTTNQAIRNLQGR